MDWVHDARKIYRRFMVVPSLQLPSDIFGLDVFIFVLPLSCGIVHPPLPSSSSFFWHHLCLVHYTSTWEESHKEITPRILEQWTVLASSFHPSNEELFHLLVWFGVVRRINISIQFSQWFWMEEFHAAFRWKLRFHPVFESIVTFVIL